MLRLFFILHFVLLAIFSYAQTAPGKYWVQFTDKDNSEFSIDQPGEFLSARCIERRQRLAIGFDDKDLPVNQHYINQVIALGNCVVHHRSKWFNAITIMVDDTSVVEQIASLPFVYQVKSVAKVRRGDAEEKIKLKTSDAPPGLSKSCGESFAQYGHGMAQISMLNGHLLHALGHTGKDISIAQFDAGWNMTDKLPVFEKLRNEGRIIMEKDFVHHNDTGVYTLSNHGTFVLSTMAAWWPDSLIGTAPDASYCLFRTEDPQSEYLVEEDNWVAAAELSDSLGIDIINSSLGYSLFDDPAMNHSYADMDGETTHCSIAADIAASKGILIVNSAGNSGASDWRYITAPSDGDDVLCVGAVDSNEMHADFSGYGPSADGDVKPDLVAMGKGTAFADLDSTVSTGNGTSFSGPVLAGMAACLMQAFPERSNMEILQTLRESGSQFNSPDDSLGYGIPDMLRALMLLQSSEGFLEGDFKALAYPNPCVESLSVILFDSDQCDVDYEVYDASGRRVSKGSGVLGDSNRGILFLDDEIKKLIPGNYTLHLGRAGEHSVIHFQKMTL